MTILSTFRTSTYNSAKTIAKLAIPAFAALALSSGVAAAKCYVNDNDKGWGGYHDRDFSGNSAKTIWDKYCKPYIQRTIANNNIQNADIGMNCHGKLSCKIRGRLEDGKLVITELNYGNSSSNSSRTTAAKPRNDAIYSDSGWSALDRAVANCSSSKRTQQAPKQEQRMACK